MMKELELKIKLIGFILDKFKGALVSSEVRFHFGSRRADVIALDNDIAIAFEIKSARDSVERLQYQIASYISYFDVCYVVCVESNISSVRKVISKGIGIILVTDSCIEIVRKAYVFKKQDKLSLCSTIPVPELKKLKHDKAVKSKYELCLSACLYNSFDEIKSLSRSNLKRKISDSFSTFYNELGDIITPDDILTLTRTSSGTLS
ncbi:sce7726 family protein [Yersinia kristensenii]|nr:sce7726 family protein [Yersinia kristensenii]